MEEALVVAGIWFIGFSIFIVGVWILAELDVIEHRLINELDNIRLEIQSKNLDKILTKIEK